MTNGFYQKIALTGGISNTPHIGSLNLAPNISLTDEVQSNSFKDTMSGLAGNLNQELNAPDKLLKSAMNGDENVDIHDVMTAMAKAEMSISIATQATSKVIQAYDKIMQISV